MKSALSHSEVDVAEPVSAHTLQVAQSIILFQAPPVRLAPFGAHQPQLPLRLRLVGTSEGGERLKAHQCAYPDEDNLCFKLGIKKV